MIKTRFCHAIQISMLWISTCLFSTNLLAQQQLISMHAIGTCLSSSGGGASIHGCTSNSAQQSFILSAHGKDSNIHGGLKISGQCLEARGQGQALAFSPCKQHPSQDWTYIAATGQLHNAQGLCVDINSESRQSGATLIGWPCHGSKSQKWVIDSRSDYQIIAVQGMAAVSAGTPLLLKERKLLNAQNMQVVATQLPNRLASLPHGIQLYAAGLGHVIAYRNGS